MDYVAFIETRLFTKRIADLLNDADYAEFQNKLARNPRKWPVIEHTGGLRKVRWGLRDTGKSGGLRLIYLHLNSRNIIYLLFVFAKGENDDLTSDQKNQLKTIVDAIKWEYRE